MKMTIIPALKALLYYVPTLFCGVALARQITRIPGVGESAPSMKAAFVSFAEALPGIGPATAPFWAETFLLIAAMIIAGATAGTIKRSRKKRDFARQDRVPAETETEAPGAVRALAILAGLIGKVLAAAVVGLFLLGSYTLFSSIYSGVAQWTGGLIAGWSPALWKVVNTIAAKVILGALIIQLASWLYALLVSQKHPPIQVRFKIDGYMWPTRRLHPIALMARKSALVLYAQSDRTRGLHGATVPVAKIRARSYHDTPETDHYVLVRSDLEPQRKKKELTIDDVDLVVDFLREYAEKDIQERHVAPNRIAELARDSGIYREAFRGRLKSPGSSLTPADVGTIVRALGDSTSQDALSIPPQEVAAQLSREQRYAHGGRFFCSVFDGKPLTPTVMLKENIPQTIACSRDPKQGYGSDFVAKKKLLMVLQHRRFQSGTAGEQVDDIEEDDFADDGLGDEGATPVNIIKEDRKAWNQILRGGLGEAYIIRMGDRQFVYDGWWWGSGQWLTDWIPYLRNRRLAIRRIGYVSDEKRRTVAKIADVWWKAATKLAGNYDRIVDVYDPRLAADKNFGLTLCLLSQFMTRQALYRENRLQQILPTTTPGGADDDVAL
jgi:hypothetical protein